jgi:hypothetical protein
MMRKLVLAATLAASLGSFAIPASSEIVVRRAPPEARYEAVPQARRGMLWVPGHWDWRNNRHVWVRGVWVRERAGYHYRQPAWVERDGRWAMERGNWRRGDRDGDGVPNYPDRAPSNPNRS